MPKIIPAVSIGVITVLAILFITGSGNNNEDLLKQNFQVEAIYDSGNVEIKYQDKSRMTSSVVLEILGMSESYQKIFFESEFTENVPFPNVPKYGWSIHPVVLNIDHEKFGVIQIKTEIHPVGEPVPPTIYGKP